MLSVTAYRMKQEPTCSHGTTKQESVEEWERRIMKPGNDEFCDECTFFVEPPKCELDVLTPVSSYVNGNAACPEDCKQESVENVFNESSTSPVEFYGVEVHTCEVRYRCDVCDKLFARSAYLEAHRRTHTGEKSYKCDQCDKSYARNGHLKEHKLKHTGETPYNCNQCEKNHIPGAVILKITTYQCTLVRNRRTN